MGPQHGKARLWRTWLLPLPLKEELLLPLNREFYHCRPSCTGIAVPLNREFYPCPPSSTGIAFSLNRNFCPFLQVPYFSPPLGVGGFGRLNSLAEASADELTDLELQQLIWAQACPLGPAGDKSCTAVDGATSESLCREPCRAGSGSSSRPAAAAVDS